MLALGIGIFFLAFAVLIYVIVRRTRLELAPDAIRLHQFGYMLETEWGNVACLSDAPDPVALVLESPMMCSGARTLAANRRAQSQPGVTFYSEEQIRLIAEHRLIPIDAFGYWMNRGLRDDLMRRAPAIKNCSEIGV
jgi:hypothetical protein